VAIVSYDIRPEFLADFSTDKSKAYEAMKRLRMAGFSKSNLYNALVDTVDRISRIERPQGYRCDLLRRRYFQQTDFCQGHRRIQEGAVPIYAIGLMQALGEYYNARGALGSIRRLDFPQADNQMRTFAKETGGMSFFPRFLGEFPHLSGDPSGVSQPILNRLLVDQPVT